MSRDFDLWAHQRRVTPDFSRRRKPIDNGSSKPRLQTPWKRWRIGQVPQRRAPSRGDPPKAINLGTLPRRWMKLGARVSGVAHSTEGPLSLPTRELRKVLLVATDQIWNHNTSQPPQLDLTTLLKSADGLCQNILIGVHIVFRRWRQVDFSCMSARSANSNEDAVLCPVGVSDS